MIFFQMTEILESFMEMPFLSSGFFSIVLLKKKKKDFWFSVDAKKSKEWATEISLETKGTLNFSSKSTWGVSNGPCQIDVLIGMAVAQQLWVQHRAC